MHTSLVSDTDRIFETECLFDGELGRYVVLAGQQFYVDSQDHQSDVSLAIFVFFLNRPLRGK
jgi:hypothetical protein